MKNIEIINTNQKIKKYFSFTEPLWFGRSFISWINFLSAELFIILSISSLGTWLSAFWGFFAGINFGIWYEDKLINTMQKLIKDLMDFHFHLIKLIQRREN